MILHFFGAQKSFESRKISGYLCCYRKHYVILNMQYKQNVDILIKRDTYCDVTVL